MEQYSEKQLEKWSTNLQNTVLYNRILLFFAKKLKNYQNSNINFAYYVFVIVLLIFINICTFTFINMAIFKVDTANFSFDKIPSFFTFVYYSFNNLLSTPISELTAASTISQGLSMITTISAWFTAAIFIALIFSVKSKKHSDDLEKIIKEFTRQGMEIELFIKEEYKINNIQDALLELEKVKAIFIRFLYKISENIK